MSRVCYVDYSYAQFSAYFHHLLLARRERNQRPATVSGQTCPNTPRQSSRSATFTVQSAFISAAADPSAADGPHEFDPYAPSTKSRSATFTCPSLFTSPMHRSLRFPVVESPPCMPLPASPDPWPPPSPQGTVGGAGGARSISAEDWMRCSRPAVSASTPPEGRQETRGDSAAGSSAALDLPGDGASNNCQEPASQRSLRRPYLPINSHESRPQHQEEQNNSYAPLSITVIDKGADPSMREKRLAYAWSSARRGYVMLSTTEPSGPYNFIVSPALSSLNGACCHPWYLRPGALYRGCTKCYLMYL